MSRSSDNRKCLHAHKHYSLPFKSGKLEDYDYSFLMAHTGKPRNEIDKIFENYNLSKIDKQTFINIYQELHHEPREVVKEIADHVFKAFDNDCIGYITFNKLMLAYALTNRGDMRRKLEYTFDLYDSDKSGYLVKNDIRDIIYGMCDVHGIDSPLKLVDKALKEIHIDHECRVYKGKDKLIIIIITLKFNF